MLFPGAGGAVATRTQGHGGLTGRTACSAGAGAHCAIVCLQVGGSGPSVSGAGRRFLVSRHHSGGVHAARLLHEDAAGVPGTCTRPAPRSAACSASRDGANLSPGAGSCSRPQPQPCAWHTRQGTPHRGPGWRQLAGQAGPYTAWEVGQPCSPAVHSGCCAVPWLCCPPAPLSPSRSRNTWKPDVSLQVLPRS